jgi:hypothetical protein
MFSLRGLGLSYIFELPAILGQPTMTHLILILTTLLFVSCGHDYENTMEQKKLFEARKTQPPDTLICEFTSSTGSLDLYYLQGNLTLPADIKFQLSDTLTRDIKVCGNFPKDLINMTSWNYDPDLAYKIVGKTILADKENAVGKVPLFYVTEWTKFYYDYNGWLEKADLGTYPKRKKMVDGILKNLMLKGQTISEIKNLLGEPDYVGKNEFGYKIDEDYGTDIDPIATTTLTIKFQDSVITEAKKYEWKKNNR